MARESFTTFYTQWRENARRACSAESGWVGLCGSSSPNSAMALRYLLAFRIPTMPRMVFQFRVVTGTPNSLSTWPR